MSAHASGGRQPPGRREPSVPWAGWTALVDTVGVYVVAQLVGVALATGWAVATGSLETLPPALLVVASPVALGMAAYVWLRVRYGTRAAAVSGRRRFRPSDVAAGLGVGVGAFLAVQLVVLRGLVELTDRFDVELPTVQDTFRVIAQDRTTAPLLVVSALAFAPLAEELVFRGLLFQGIRDRSGFWLAALVSAAAFTLPHLGDGGGVLADLVIIAGILPLGVVFAAVMERRGSLLACVAAHATYNAGGIALLLLAPVP